MAINDNDLFPPEAIEPFGAHTLVRNGLMQSNMDAQGFMILNLDTSNLVLDELPSQPAQANKWFNSYNQGTHTFGVSQPAFPNISGNLTLAQQSAITRLGTISVGVWNATPLAASKVPRLNDIRGPDDSVVMLGERITHLGDPISDQDAVTLAMLNGRNSGTQPKAAVRAATTSNMLLTGLTHTVDGITLEDNDRVLVKNQVTARRYENGYWNAHAGAWTRTDDAQTDDDLEFATCFILEGDTQAGQTWLETNPVPFALHFNDPPPFAEFALYSVSNLITAGDGLGQTGTEIFAVGTANRISVGVGIDISDAYEGQSSITVVGDIASGTWGGDVISSEFGGTGVNNSGFSITIPGDFTVQLISGAIPESYLTFDITGATELILPRLGTLATLNGNETFTNKHISADQIDSGVLLISHGGTSANTAMAALANLLPDVTGHAGESLHTDGGTSGPAVFYWA